MLSMVRNKAKRFSLSEAIHTEVSSCLHEAFSEEEGSLCHFDRWTRRRLTLENMAKLALTLEADNPVEFCYQNLIREIDTEAMYGIYLVTPDGPAPELRWLTDEPGMSGALHDDFGTFASRMFTDLPGEGRDQDAAWRKIRAQYARARIDTAVSEIIIRYLMDDAAAAGDMSNAVRAMMYSFREDVTRRYCELAPVLGDRDRRDLKVMIDELRERAGSYADRGRLIRERAGTADPLSSRSGSSDPVRNLARQRLP